MPSSTYTCPASDLLLLSKQWMILVFIVSRRVSDVKHCLTVKYQLFTNIPLMVLIGRCVAGWAWWWWYSWTIKVAATGSSTTRHGTAWRWPTSSFPGGCTRLVLVGACVFLWWVHASSPDSFPHFLYLVHASSPGAVLICLTSSIMLFYFKRCLFTAISFCIKFTFSVCLLFAVKLDYTSTFLLHANCNLVNLYPPNDLSSSYCSYKCNSRWLLVSSAVCARWSFATCNCWLIVAIPPLKCCPAS